MAILQQTAPGEWDPTQFKLQADGTFRISIRGMAAMAGVDQSLSHRLEKVSHLAHPTKPVAAEGKSGDRGSLGRSLKSAGDENPLPCARSLLAQGFCPGDVSSWSETGGIPEEAAQTQESPQAVRPEGFRAMLSGVNH